MGCSLCPNGAGAPAPDLKKIVLDAGASKDLVLDTGASKDLDSVVARDEGDLPEVGFMGMHDSEDVGFDFAYRVKVFNWTLARCSWWLVQAFGAGELLSIHIQQCADVFCFGNTWVVLTYQSKTAFILTTESGKAVFAATAGHFAVVRGAADMDIMFRLPGPAEQL